MLSATELQHTHVLLDLLSSSLFTIAQQRNVRRRHKIKEHHYAAHYP